MSDFSSNFLDLDDEFSAYESSAEETAMMQGTLVMSRGLNDTKPFRNFLKTLPDILKN